MSPHSEKKPTRRRFLKASGAGAVAMTLAGCSSQTDNSQKKGTGTETEKKTEKIGESTPKEVKKDEKVPEGGTFTFGMTSPPKGLNVLATSSAYTFVILNLIYEGGTTLEPVNFNVEPNVYTDWKAENTKGKNAKPDVYFNVREGLTFNDGKKMTLDDVLFTYKYLLAQKPGRFVSTIEAIDKVEEASNDWDVHMKMNKPVGTYMIQQLGVPILPKHVWQDVKDFKTYQPYKEGGPVGLGPGKVTRYQPDTATEVTFRDDYTLSSLDWVKNHPNLRAGGPFLDTFRVKVYGSDAAQSQALLNGEIDTVYGSAEPSKIEKIKKKKGYTLIDGFDTGYGHYSFNLRRVPLDDAAFRQALSFVYDDYFWTQRLLRGYAIEGDFVMPPGFAKVRPETAASDAKILTDPATQPFTFRQSKPGIPDIKAVRQFLTEGKVIDGEPGTFAGKKYPGSLTGVKAQQSEAKHDYTFGPVESNVLRSNPDVDKEIRINGKTLTEIHGGPLVELVYPAKKAPETAKMTQKWVSAIQLLGVPIETKVITFNSTLGKVYGKEDFDMFTMGWVNLSPFAVGTLYSLFHSDNADDHSKLEGFNKQNTSISLNNAMGYSGADDLIMKARTEMDPKKRNEIARKAVERVYLDFPTMVDSYGKVKWPVNSAEFDGFVENIPGPGYAYLTTEIKQIYKKQ